MKLTEVIDDNLRIYLNLAQGYEAEFSAITWKKPNHEGVFALDTIIGGKVRGFLYYFFPA